MIYEMFTSDDFGRPGNKNLEHKILFMTEYFILVEF